MKKITYLIAATVLLLTACSKDDTPTPAVDFTQQEDSVINDFVNRTAIPQYQGLAAAANVLNIAVDTLHNNPTTINLQAAKLAWKNVRVNWEQCEGFLFGPIEDNDYDPNTDTWPTDYTQLDSIITSSNPLEVSDIANLPQSLRGYHPIEFVLFGRGSGRTVTNFTDTPRLLKYAVSLSDDLYTNNALPLLQSWTAGGDNYAQKILNPSSSNNKFKTKQDVFLAIIGAMSDICGEVGEGKMKEPFDAHDSTITESPYSNNTTTDFKNNIIGIQNVYMGLNGGRGLKDLVALKNKNLDNQIQAKITEAINSFNNITLPYEQAIYTQRSLVQQTMDKLGELKVLLDNDLTTFVTTYVKD
ncbi:imelysin family protein [Ferruginibacter albus]|uniref:imelysin family protein n=1 Tax=Ferruginibacter albus TaxID=2875540 RepID=UPI001CC588B8|nr:imelysin family protein [Ferruginibacter albus]UAY51553.1 hypothetical protein K9M53_13270 [Ferruginibacter albus]